MERFLAREVTVEPGARGQSSLFGEARPPLVLLFAVAAMVLAIACANIANLLLARGAAALAAGLVPALRASRIDPMLALRYE